MSYPRLLARGSSETIHSADIERVATLSSSSCIPDRQMTQYSHAQKSTVRRSSGGVMPRLPQRGRLTPIAPVSETSRCSPLSRCVVAEGRLTTFEKQARPSAMTSFGTGWRKDTEGLDSGLGLEEQQQGLGRLSLPSSLCNDEVVPDHVGGTRSAPVVVPSAPVLKSRCIEHDCEPMVQTAQKMDAVYFQKSQPSFLPIVTEQPKVAPSPAVPTSTSASELYSQRLEGIKQHATELFRLHKGLELLLPNTEGDT